jgi:two-component system, LuxR family, sensor kinase FixL
MRRHSSRVGRVGASAIALRGNGYGLDRIILSLISAGRARVLAIAFLLMAGIAVADWQVGLDVSLGILYIIPMVLVALVLPTPWIVGMALLCAAVRRLFEIRHTGAEGMLRFLFGTIAYLSAGLFVAAVLRNREEQARRTEAEEQLDILAESSPAGILTLDSRGVVLGDNAAVQELLGVAAGESLKGQHIAQYLPLLADALQVDTGATPFRTAAQAQGKRQNGELFLADIWFSTYPSRKGKRLAAIVIDSSEEMRNREEQNLRQLRLSSRIMAGAMLHEIRNLCSAIAVVYSNVAGGPPDTANMELQGLDHLIKGLARIASLDLNPDDQRQLDTVSASDVLSDLRIIAEPSWSEAGATIHWNVPGELPKVLADRQGLLQVFLNLAQNSLRAVQDKGEKKLSIGVSVSPEKVSVRMQDSGVGVSDPASLFQPFQAGATSTGLGLYISRSLLRSYGGDLKFDPPERGAAFVVELVRAAQRDSRV